VAMKTGELEMSKPPPISLHCIPLVDVVGIASAAVLLLLVFLYYKRGCKSRTSTEESMYIPACCDRRQLAGAHLCKRTMRLFSAERRLSHGRS
jgi:hypothetical protein